MSAYQLAQLNVATLLEPIDSPRLADFVANLARINALAESSPGFVWRLQDEAGDATALRPFGPEVIVNMSVWSGVDALRAFVFQSDHVAILRRRREWFERAVDAYAVLWWVPAGHRPTLEEARVRLDLLRTHGPGAEAFTFRAVHAAPAAPAVDALATDDVCPAT